jgi:hypothetical protein
VRIWDIIAYHGHRVVLPADSCDFRPEIAKCVPATSPRCQDGSSASMKIRTGFRFRAAALASALLVASVVTKAQAWKAPTDADSQGSVLALTTADPCPCCDQCPCCSAGIGGDYMCRPTTCTPTWPPWGPVCPPTVAPPATYDQLIQPDGYLSSRSEPGPTPPLGLIAGGRLRSASVRPPRPPVRFGQSPTISSQAATVTNTSTEISRPGR